MKRVPLPDVLGQIADAVSIEAAMKVARAHGGTMAYVPAKVEAGHWLAELLGLEDARKVCAALGPASVLVPMGPNASTARRWRTIQALIDAGVSKRQIARRMGVHIRTVQRHRQGGVKSMPTVLAQTDLFEN